MSGVVGVDFSQLGNFLNDENKNLDTQLKALQLEVEDLTEQIEEQKERKEIMQQHLNSVKSQVTNKTSLVRAKQKEIEDEQHHKDLNNRQMGKLKEMMKEYQKSASDLEERNAELQNQLFRRKDEIDALSGGIKLNQNEFDNWKVVLKQKELDIDAIAKYSTADEARIRDLQMNLERMQKELGKRKNELEQEITNAQSLQIELDKTEEDFRQIEKERHKLYQQFEDVVTTIEERDAKIKDNEEEYRRRQEEMNKLKETIKKQEAILEQNKQENNQLEAKISQINAGLQRLLTEKQHWEHVVQQDTDELAVQRGILRKEQVALNQLKKEAQSTAELIEQKKLQNINQQEKLQKKKELLASVTNETKDKGAQSQMIEAMLAEEEQRNIQATRELEELKQEIFKQSQLLFQTTQEKTNIIAEISGSETSLKNLNAKIKRLDEESLRQNEIIYHADFQIQLMERKIPRAMGVRSDEEKQVLNAKIAQLQDEMNVQAKQQQILSQQVKKLDSELLEVTKQIEKSKAQKKHIESKIADVKLTNDNTVRALSQHRTEKEQKAVAHDVLELELKKLRDTFHQRHSEVVSLKNRQDQLELTIRERAQEIKAHNDLLRSEVRHMDEEKHKVAKELNDRTMKIDKLKLKYESVIGIRGGNPTEESARSHAYAIVQAAQKRQELEAKGDALYAEITTKQKELTQLENALIDLTKANVDYRNTFKQSGASSQDLEEKKTEEERLKGSQQKLKQKRSELGELQQLVAYQQRMTEESESEAEVLQREVKDLEAKRLQLEKEVSGQLPKIERAQKQLQKMSQEHRQRFVNEQKGGLDESGDTPIEREFQMDELKETNQIILSSLIQIGQQDPRIAPVLESLLKEHNVPTKGLTATGTTQLGQTTPARAATRKDSAPLSATAAPKRQGSASQSGTQSKSPSRPTSKTTTPVQPKQKTGSRPISSKSTASAPKSASRPTSAGSTKSTKSNGKESQPNLALTATSVPATPKQPSSRPASPPQTVSPPKTSSRPTTPPKTPSRTATPPKSPSRPATPPKTPSRPSTPPKTPSRPSSPKASSKPQSPRPPSKPASPRPSSIPNSPH
ncbi:putative flagella associated protein [Blattamonas nauphoetae]|uniref:Flagella associated protein n=1 Tax=Blattamonas nauphoetae TaxID=2049346 RepID=A0ABQ9YK43_9EUKA|nr:putative flagella associated protein [Blattamonas nauphoetae]